MDLLILSVSCKQDQHFKICKKGQFTPITGIHGLGSFPRGYSNKFKNAHVTPTGEIYSFTHSLYYSRHASFQKLIILLRETETHERVKHQ